MYSFSITHTKFNIIRQLLNHGFELMNIYTSAIAFKSHQNIIKPHYQFSQPNSPVTSEHTCMLVVKIAKYFYPYIYFPTGSNYIYM